ncbi:MAG TPA: hypothetical protein VFV41_21510 [Streptosporangiaceae bacterium]|nr:hypothetical protein [Streptosporangiaceae bacterium]
MLQNARPRPGRVLGLAAILTAAGLACGSGLPALAAPAGHQARAARTAHAARAAVISRTAGRPHIRRLLLITGDRLVIRSQGSRRLIASRAAVQGDPMISMRHGSSITEVPAAALPYLGRGLSPALFQLSALEKAESGGRLPVRVTFTGSRPSIPGLTVTSSGPGTAAGYLTAASAPAFGAALLRQYGADHSAGSYGTDGLFGHNVSITPAGAGTVAAARTAPAGTAGPAFRMHTLTVRGTNLAGKPDTGDDVFIVNADNVNSFNSFSENDNFFWHGVAKFSMPAGHYMAFVTFFKFTRTGGSIRMVIAPQFSVAGKHSVLRVAEKSASSKVTMTTPRPAQDYQSTFEVVRADQRGRTFTISSGWGDPFSAWVRPTTRKVTVGSMHTYTSGMLISPPAATASYAYNLDFPGPSGIIPSQHFSAGTTASVTERYYQDKPTSHAGWVTFGGTREQLEFEFLSIPYISMPQVQTQFFTAAPKIMWENQIWTNLNQFAGFQTDLLRVYQPGEHQTQSWNRYPLHPAQDTTLGGAAAVFPTFTSAARLGNRLELSQWPWSDNQFGHTSDGFFGNGNAATTGSYVIDQNGRRIARGNAVDGIPLIRLSAAPSTIKYTLRASRSGGSFFRLSPSSTTTWTWHSKPDPSATVPKAWVCGYEVVQNQFKAIRTCAVQPLLTLNYRVQGMGLDGLTQPGAQTISLHVGHIQLGGSAAITGATAQVSYNDGDSWVPATVTAQGGGRFAITFDAPAGVDVSLKVSASDAGGSSITETLIRGYGVGQ